MTRIRALVFDFDGLILDTEVPDYQSWQEIYQEHGCSLPLSQWVEDIGRAAAASSFSPCDHLESQVGAVDRAAIRARRRERYLSMCAANPILPGVLEYLEEGRRRGLKLAVASSADRNWVTGHLARLELLDRFSCVRCVEDVERAKPDPALYHCAVEALGVRPGEAIAFEDSPNGVKAARAAGLFCVAVPNPLTCELPLAEAHLRLASLADMPLEKLIEQAEQPRGGRRPETEPPAEEICGPTGRH